MLILGIKIARKDSKCNKFVTLHLFWEGPLPNDKPPCIRYRLSLSLFLGCLFTECAFQLVSIASRVARLTDFPAIYRFTGLSQYTTDITHLLPTTDLGTFTELYTETVSMIVFQILRVEYHDGVTWGFERRYLSLILHVKIWRVRVGKVVRM